MNVYTIAPRLPFADVVAAGLLREAGGDPSALAAMTVLVPSRRAQRTLREAFLRQSDGRPLLLPRIAALGDVDEDEALFASFMGEGLAEAAEIPPAIPPLRRQLLLTRLILALPQGVGAEAPLTPDQAARLAAELARLLDEVQTEGLGFERLASLVPDAYARHWQVTLDFLRILTEVWPTLLAAEGCIDPVERRNRLYRAQAAAWRSSPPSAPIVAAGVTGSIPAQADLLATLAGLPSGRVVLPGLDRSLDEESWSGIEESHPQYALKQFLNRLGLSRADVADFPYDDRPAHPEGRAHSERERLVSEVMRPASTTDRWRALPALDPVALRNVERIDCATSRDEALTIAMLMRDAVEKPGFTCALVTPDRDLARRVSAELGRWGLRVDDSAGRPLAVTPPGTFLRLSAEMVANGFAPVPMLACLKHPLAAGGMARPAFREAVRRLERAALRGVRPGPGIEGLRMALAVTGQPERGLEPLLQSLDSCCAAFAARMGAEKVPFGDLLEAHMRMAEALACTDGGTPDAPDGALHLWAGEAGEEAARFAAELADWAGCLDPIRPSDYPALLDTLMIGRAVRPDYGGHPRLHILGLLEARLQHADLMILGGMNEGVWPSQVQADPWMSRPMRGAFGLPLPEWRVGITAHDFASLFCAPRVVVTRAEKVDGTPTVPSRWLLRLDTVMSAARLPPLGGLSPWQVWAGTLDQPARLLPVQRPAPCPPVECRPRRLSATRIETWMRDPYAIYAEQVLRLRALDPLDDEPGAAEYGTLVHAALEEFLRRYPDGLPDDAHARLLECGRSAFDRHIARPAVWAFWWPRFERLAAWVVEHERNRRGDVRASYVEVRGELAVTDDFVLTATADRIDLKHDGTLAIIDYKTGTPPKEKEVAAGYAPQLPLEAVIARHGGFAKAGLPAREVSELLYWHLSGNSAGGEERSAGKEPQKLADEALAGLRGLIAAFSRPEAAYEARPHPGKAPKYSDYLHLARVKEWSAGGGEGEGE